MSPLRVFIVLVTVAPLSAAQPPDQRTKLVSILQNDNKSLAAREAALLMACQTAEPGDAPALLNLMTTWISELDAAETADASQAAKQQLVAAFVHRCAARMNAVAADKSAPLVVWTSLATRSWTDRSAKQAAVQAILDNPGSTTSLQDAAIAVLADTQFRRSRKVAASLQALLDCSSFPALRGLVEQASSPEDFNYAAASILAHAGDTGVAQQLQSFRAAWGPEDARFKRVMAWFLWQIDAQNPPSKLLSAISSSGPLPAAARTWSLRRAAELGVSQAELKDAILALGQSGAVTAGAHGAQRCLAKVASKGMELGVITEADLASMPEGESSESEESEESDDLAAWAEAGLALDPNYAWVLTLANWGTFAQWCATNSWSGMTPKQIAQATKQKLCELNLMPPSACGSGN